MKRLPRTLDDVRGLRVARWIRGSTAGQFDNHGSASQREQQDRFIERHGLLDTGLTFQVAHSGTTVWRSPRMTEMLAEARAGAFDLLLAGYSDRWQRNLRRALNTRKRRRRGASLMTRRTPASPLARRLRRKAASVGYASGTTSSRHDGMVTGVGSAVPWLRQSAGGSS